MNGSTTISPPTLLSWTASDAELDKDMLVSTHWAGPEARIRWAIRRASGPARRRELDGRGPMDPDPGRGGDSCGHLVDLHAARRQARAESRIYFKAGDGCGSRICSNRHKPAQFARRQLRFATALESRKRSLVRLPQELIPRQVWIAHSRDQRGAIARALTLAPLPPT